MRLEADVGFKIIEEGEDWIVVEKPAPLIVHPANRKPEPTLLGGVEELLSYELVNGGQLGIITRLDRETSGLVLIAKTKDAARYFGRLMEERKIEKEYLAIVIGSPAKDSWLCDESIVRAGDIGPSKIWVRQVVSRFGKECRTSFEVIRRFEREGLPYALIRCIPQSGRMHQIRVHLASCGCPIVGDKIYTGDGRMYLDWMEHGWKEDMRASLFTKRHLLHARHLKLPMHDREIEWHSQIPEEFHNFLSGEALIDADDILIT